MAANRPLMFLNTTVGRDNASLEAPYLIHDKHGGRSMLQCARAMQRPRRRVRPRGLLLVWRQVMLLVGANEFAPSTARLDALQWSLMCE
jgi:hypothetical protein